MKAEAPSEGIRLKITKSEGMAEPTGMDIIMSFQGETIITR